MRTNSRYPEELLVSRKFYSEIITRIETTLSSTQHQEARDEALGLVKSYLCGKKNRKIEAVSEIAGVVFNLLLSELDKAITRSARARKVARKRRKINFLETLIEQSSPAKRLQSKSAVNNTETTPTNYQDEGYENQTPILNRRQRRALQRELDRQRRRS